MPWYLMLVLATYAAFMAILGYVSIRGAFDDARERRAAARVLPTRDRAS